MHSLFIIFALPFIVMNVMLTHNTSPSLIVYSSIRFVSFSDTRRDRRKHPKCTRHMSLNNTSSIFVFAFVVLQSNLLALPCLLALLLRGGIESNPGPANKTKRRVARKQKQCLHCKAPMPHSTDLLYHASCKQVAEEANICSTAAPSNEAEQLFSSDFIREVSNPAASSPADLITSCSTQISVYPERALMTGPEWSVLFASADAPPNLYVVASSADVFSPITESVCLELCNTIGIPFEKTLSASCHSYSLGVPSARFSVPGDGNCLFSALSAAVSGSVLGGIWLRQLVCHTMTAIPGIEKYLMMPNGQQFANAEQYLQYTDMRNDRTYGSSLEIGVFCFLTNTTVNVYSTDSLTWLRHAAPNITGTVVVNDRNIYLVHDRDHYEPVTSTTIVLPCGDYEKSHSSNFTLPIPITSSESDDNIPLAKALGVSNTSNSCIGQRILSGSDDDVPLVKYQKRKEVDGYVANESSNAGSGTPSKADTEFDFAAIVFHKTTRKSTLQTSVSDIKQWKLGLPFSQSVSADSVDPFASSKIRKRERDRRYYAKNKVSKLKQMKDYFATEANRLVNWKRTKDYRAVESNRLRNIERRRSYLAVETNRLRNLKQRKDYLSVENNRLHNIEKRKEYLSVETNRLANVQRRKDYLSVESNRLRNLEQRKLYMSKQTNRLRNLKRTKKYLALATNRLRNLKRSREKLTFRENRLKNLENSRKRKLRLKMNQKSELSNTRRLHPIPVSLIETECISEDPAVHDCDVNPETETHGLPVVTDTPVSDAVDLELQTILKMLDDHLNNVIPTAMSAENKNETVVRVRELLSEECLLERACLVCDMLFIHDEGTYYEISSLTKSFKRKLKELLQASKVIPALHTDLQECYNIVPLLLTSGCDVGTAHEFQGLLLSPRALLNSKVFVCQTCHSGISNNRLPKLAIANNNAIGSLPEDLVDCTDMEIKLSSFVIPKLSLQTVRGGGQTQVNSHSILFDSPVDVVARTLPRLDPHEVIRVLTTSSIARCVPIHRSLRFATVRINKVRGLLRFFSKVRKEYEVFGTPHEGNISVLKNSLNNGIPRGVVETVELDPEDDIISNVGSGFTGTSSHQNEDQSRDFVYVNNAVTANYSSLNSQILDSSGRIPVDNRFFVQLGKLVSDLNPVVLPLALPTCFPYGRGAYDEKRRIVISKSLLTKRFLRLSTKQFARSHTATALLFDMESRARALSVATLSLPKEVYAQFSDVNVDQMKVAISYKARKESAVSKGQPIPAPPATEDVGHALQLLQQASFSATAMLNTPEERLAFRKNILSMQTVFGNPSVFFTINPADVQSPVLAMNGMAGLRYIDDLDTNRPSKSDRFRAVADNPVAAALWFDRVVHIVFKHLLGIDTETGVCLDDGGIFGKVYAFTGGIEQQARLSLHLHNLIWLLGVPGITQNMHDCLQNDSFLTAVTSLVNSIVTSSYSLSNELACSSCNAKATELSFIPSEEILHADKPLPNTSTEEPTVKCSCCNAKLVAGTLIWCAVTEREPKLSELALASPDEFLQRYSANSLDIQSEDTRAVDTLAQLLTCTHDFKHRPTCFEIKKVNGPVRGFCRARFPRSESDGDLVTRKPGSSWLNPHNDVILSCVGCNNDARVLLKASPALIYYTSSYTSKPQQKKATDDVMMNAAFAKRVQNEQVGTHVNSNAYDNSVTRGRGRVLSSLYVLSQSVSTGLPLASYYLLFDSAYLASHKFIKIQIPQMLNEITGIDSYHSFAANSKLSRIVPQLSDYQCRGDSISNLPYYVVISLYEKISSTAPESRSRVPIDFLTNLLLRDCGITSQFMPTNVPFTADHPQFRTHRYKLRARALVVILHGRRLYNLKIMSLNAADDDNDDDDNVHSLEDKRILVAKFILGVCKPWRIPDNLLQWSTSWFEAYHEFLSSTDLTVPLAKRLLANSQEYYIGKSDGRREQSEQGFPDDTTDHPDVGTEQEPGVEDAATDGLAAATELSASAAIIHLNSDSDLTFMTSFRPPSYAIEINLTASSEREQDWIRACSDEVDDDDIFTINVPTSNTGSEFRERFVRLVDAFGFQAIPESQRLQPSALPDMPSILQTAVAFALNVEQTAAFTTMAAYLLSFDILQVSTADVRLSEARLVMETILTDTVQNNVLYLVIHGPAGTGKSRVVQALQSFAQLWNLAHTVLVTATTGAAAVLLGAQTYHSALKLSSRNGKKNVVSPQLRSKFLQLRLMIIDEMSMLGTAALQKIDNRLRSLRGNPTQPFGGLSVILIGDYTQLQPVKDTPLYVPADGPGRSRQRITSEFYRKTFTSAICLTKNMRMAKSDSAVVEELRRPPPSLEVVDLLNSRCVEIPNEVAWFPIATTTNATRQRIINDHTVAAARILRVVGFPANFQLKGTLTTAQRLQALRLLRSSFDSQLEYLPPMLYLYIGMHVMITHNCDLQHGIANGSMGIVVGFVWQSDLTNDVCYTEECLVEDDPLSPIVSIPNTLPKFVLVKLTSAASITARAVIQMKDLPDDVWPVKTVTKDVTRSATGVRVSARMRQFPLVCADALTFYKLQGATIDDILCIDSLKGAGLQSAYTALTRVRRLNQLFLREPLLFNVARGWRLPNGLAEEQSRLRAISTGIVDKLVQINT